MSAGVDLELVVPDLGGFSDVAVIDVLVRVGDAIEADQPLITLETDKATMDVPAAAAGTLTELRGGQREKRPKGNVGAHQGGRVPDGASCASRCRGGRNASDRGRCAV
jgi:hypothetical protein